MCFSVRYLKLSDAPTRPRLPCDVFQVEYYPIKVNTRWTWTHQSEVCQIIVIYITCTVAHESVEDVVIDILPSGGTAPI